MTRRKRDGVRRLRSSWLVHRRLSRRQRWLVIAICSVLAVVAGARLAWPPANTSVPAVLTAPPAPQSSLFGTTTPSDARPSPDRQSVELGLRFTVTKDAALLGVRFFRPESDDQEHAATLWNIDGTALRSTVFPARLASGWQSVAFTSAAQLSKGKSYVVSYHASAGYVAQPNYFTTSLANGILRTPPVGSPAGLFAYSTGPVLPTKSFRSTNYWVDPIVEGADGSPAPYRVPTGAAPRTAPAGDAPVPSGFPGPDNTGVPDGVTLTPYTGPSTITRRGTVIDAKHITGTIAIEARDVVIRRSDIAGNVFVDDDDASVTIMDSDVDSGGWSPPTIGYRNLTVRRSDVRGGQHSIRCDSNCVVEDSWLHDQYLPVDEAFHNNAFLSSGGSHIVLRGNTFHCTPRPNALQGGCTADVSLFADFGPVVDVVVNHNLFRTTAGGYCGSFGTSIGKPFGDRTTGVVITDNVFERGVNGTCGRYGVASAVGSAPQTSWSGNRWVGGGPIPSGG